MFSRQSLYYSHVPVAIVVIVIKVMVLRTRVQQANLSIVFDSQHGECCSCNTASHENVGKEDVHPLCRKDQ